MIVRSLDEAVRSFAEEFGIELYRVQSRPEDLAKAWFYKRLTDDERLPDFPTAVVWFSQRNIELTEHDIPDSGEPGFTLTGMCYLLQPIRLLNGLKLAYHATSSRNRLSIEKGGLKPGCKAEGRCNFPERSDSEGRTYFAEYLGAASDAGVPEMYSGHWWRDHLEKAREKQIGGPADSPFETFEVDFSGLSGVDFFEDQKSDSGFFIQGVSIPPELLTLVYSEGSSGTPRLKSL
jgi:hypothetical protein